MHKMIGEVCTATSIPALSMPDLLFKEGIPSQEWDNDAALLEFIVPGRVYYGFRHLPLVLTQVGLQLREKKSVLLVRDPRDALVSEYYSYGGKHISHKLPDKGKDAFIERIKMNAELEIDEYALRFASNHLKKLKAYLANLDFDRVLLRRYEQIYFDKRTFLGEIFEHFGLNVPAEVLDRVAAKNDIRPSEENVGKHIRKGSPGDYREKLQPQTIAKLNAIFGDTCSHFGYDLQDRG